MSSAEYTIEYRKANREKVRAWSRAAYYRHRKSRLAQQSRYKKNNKEKILEYQREWCRKNAEHIREYRKRRRQENPQVMLAERLRSRIFKVLHRGRCRKSNPTLELLGAPDIQTVRNHIEQLFQEGMNWENFGDWHIDHILPCSMFDLTKSNEQKGCFYYGNLRPMWAKENMSKGGSLIVAFKDRIQGLYKLCAHGE